MDGEGFLWRRIGEKLLADIDSGRLRSGSRLPADTDLAARFGVNRHTVRRALQDLQDRGLVRSERGRGTFIIDDVLEYRLGKRTRFTENLIDAGRVPGRELIDLKEDCADAATARTLEISRGANILRLLVRGTADGVPLSVGENRFPGRRLPGLRTALLDNADAGRISITQALRAVGTPVYRRAWTIVSARLPSADEAKYLRMPLACPVLVTESLDVDAGGRPVNFAQTVFCAERLQFRVEA